MYECITKKTNSLDHAKTTTFGLLMQRLFLLLANQRPKEPLL